MRVHPYKHFQSHSDPVEKLDFSVPGFSLLDCFKVDEREIESKSKTKGLEKDGYRKSY